MPFVRIWVHAIWSTHGREPLLDGSARPRVFEHIFQNGRKKGIEMGRVNGYADHVHALFALPNDIPISKAIQLLKGESSYWINKNSIVRTRFEWQDEYFVKSVGEESLLDTCQYIDNQEEHHRRVPFSEEYNKFVQSLTDGVDGLKSFNLALPGSTP